MRKSIRVQAEIGRSESQIEAARSAASQMKEAKIRLDGLAADLANCSFFKDEQARLKAIGTELKALGFDDEFYSQALQQMRKLEPFIQLKDRLEAARAQLPAEEHGPEAKHLGMRQGWQWKGRAWAGKSPKQKSL